MDTSELLQKIEQTKKSIKLCTCKDERKTLIKMLIEYQKKLNDD
jgi:hypothetical protein